MLFVLACQVVAVLSLLPGDKALPPVAFNVWD